MAELERHGMRAAPRLWNCTPKCCVCARLTADACGLRSSLWALLVHTLWWLCQARLRDIDSYSLEGDAASTRDLY